ncbi:MAG: hypothetical protein IMZ66_07695 [Planctomycetes bacterium]|nr:hypothetical protein [Planctomycetota bacterium]
MKSDALTRESLDALARESDRIVNLILHTSLPRVDIEIQIEDFREECLRRYPGSEDLFEMVYASRFRRILEQWGDERPRADEATRSAWDE